MRLTTIFLVLAFAMPASAQLAPGEAIDVYDANGTRVGHYVGRAYQRDDFYAKFDVALEHDGQQAVVEFHQAVDGSSHWGSRDYGLYFSSGDCTGVAYRGRGSTEDPILGTETGHRYRALDATLYRYLPSSQTVTIQTFSRLTGTGCQGQNSSFGIYQVAEAVGSP